MNCIVTAGPTFEPLDDVRRITNFSTGRLGTDLANYLTARGHRVTLLLGEQATCKGGSRARMVNIFSTTADLRARLKSLSGGKVDALFHAAAVSDFGFGKMFIRPAAGRLEMFRRSKKISTRRGTLLVELIPTPKIIAELRRWFPRAKIVGWKFEVVGSRRDALRSARRQIRECATDGCVANGPAYGRGFSLVSSLAQTHAASTKKLFHLLERLAAGN